MNISEQIRSPFNSRYPHEGKKKELDQGRGTGSKKRKGHF